MSTQSQENMANEQPILVPLSPPPLAMTKAPRSIKTPKKSWDADKALKSTHNGLFGKYQLRAYLLVALGYGIVSAWLTEMPAFALQHSVWQDASELPYIVYILGLALGGLIFGHLADLSGRKMILLGSMWTACALSIFQLLSDDDISYVFFIFFIGLAIGAVQVITIPYVMEMFSIESRAIYGLSLVGVVFLLDLVMPWVAMLVKNWKVLQVIITVPLILTAILYWITEESMFWYTAQKDFLSAVLSLTKIARFNGVVFEDVFREARDFLRGKQSKGIQCDFQPLLRLEDIKSLGSKYPDFDMVDLQAINSKKNRFPHRVLDVITGHHYYPTLSTFYPTDYLHSSILTVYLLVLCGLWLVSSLTEYSLDVPHLSQHLGDDFFLEYFYTHLIQIISFAVAFPLVYIWGRRWPTFCFFLVAEVCLLGSVAVKLDGQQTRAAMLVVYFTGKFATRAAFVVLIIYTCEIFPTGLRCTTLGICYTFRLIGIALASPNVGELNDWMPRLIYGILALVLGSLALLLPETKKFPLPRTMLQVEVMPTSVSETFRRQRAALVKRKTRQDGTQPDSGQGFSDVGSVLSAARSVRPYDNQSTIHSVYELQEFGQYDTVNSITNRNSSRRMDPRNAPLYHPYSTVNSDTFRQQQSIAEDVEGSDIDDDRLRFALQKQELAATKNPLTLANDNVIVLPKTAGHTSITRHSGPDMPSQLEATAHIQAGSVTTDPIDIPDQRPTSNQTDKFSQSPRYQRTMSQEENYFSEHC